MYTKIASALLISAVLMTPVAALAAGGNIAKVVDGKLCIKTSGGPNRVVVTGTLDLAYNEKATEIWAWVYQPAGARAVYKMAVNISGPVTDHAWAMDPGATAGSTIEYRQDDFEAGNAAVAALLIFTKGGSLNSYGWYRGIQLVTSGAPC